MSPILPSYVIGPRSRAVDVAKGAGMLLIAFWHSPLKDELPQLHAVQQLFSVPLFFFLSGALFRPADGFAQVWRGKALTILGPYITTLGVVWLAAHWRPNLGTPANVWAGGLWGTGETLPQGFAPLWFLPALLTTVLAGWMVLRVMSNLRVSAPSRWVVITGLVAVGGASLQGLHAAPGAVLGAVFIEYSSRMGQAGWPWSLDLLPLTLGYFLAGAELRSFVFKPTAPWQAVALAALGLAMATAAHSFRMDLNLRIFAPALGVTVASAAGLYLTLAFAAVMQRWPRLSEPLAFIGSMSLVILCFHMWLGSVFGYAIQKYGLLDGAPARAAVTYAASIVLPLVASLFIRRLPVARDVFGLRRASVRSTIATS